MKSKAVQQQYVGLDVHKESIQVAVMDKDGKVPLFVDNASYHRAALVREQLAEWNGDVVLKFLPPYTPELNKIEGQWRGFKKATANRLYQTVDEMQKSIRVMLRRGEIKICEMSDYLS